MTRQESPWTVSDYLLLWRIFNVAPQTPTASNRKVANEDMISVMIKKCKVAVKVSATLKQT